MAYGEKRNPVYTDLFDTSISGSWANGEGGWNSCAWNAGAGGEGVVRTGIAGSGSAMRYASSLSADQYVTVKLNTLSAADDNEAGPQARAQVGALGSYEFLVTSAGGAGNKYILNVMDNAGSETLLANSGTPGAGAQGWTATIECEGTTIRCGTSEGGADTQRLTTTDNTWSTGRGGIQVYAQSNTSRSEVTAFEAGNIAPIVAVPAQSLIVKRPRTRYAA